MNKSLYCLVQQSQRGGIQFTKMQFGVNIPFYKFSQKQDKTSKPKMNKKQLEAEEMINQELQRMDNVKQQIVNQLVVQQQKNKQDNKTKKDFRDAILFQEVLRKEKLITVYDTKGKVFRHQVYMNIGGIVAAMGLFLLFLYGERYEKSRYWYCVPCILFSLSRLRIYREFQKFYVDKVIYNTETQKFDIFKRSLIGRNKLSTVDRNMILFTQDEVLNNKNINYINMDTLECYQIGYTYAWTNQALFAHLIEQRISSIKK